MAKVAPEQMYMSDLTARKWHLPDEARPFFKNLDDAAWVKWEQGAKPPLMYDPPQLAPGYLHWLASCCNWWTQRSPCCAANPPFCPVGCADCIYSCFVPDRVYLNLLDPDDWMVKMLKTGSSPNCPERFKGIWWMCDNIVSPSHLLTLHDAEWANDRLALKNVSFNWTRGPTCFGAVLAAGNKLRENTLRFSISPNGKWISIAATYGDPTWIYIPDPEEEFVTFSGNVMKPDPEEMMRLTTEDDAVPNSKLKYQYRVRRIAYLDQDGQLVKTDAYDEMRQRALEPMKFHPCCCGHFFCCQSKEKLAFRNFGMLSTHTVISYAPPAPGSTGRG